MVSEGGSRFGDTTYLKIFVGGLAWETQRDTMKSYFEQFGEIHEAVVITDRNSGKSKGYGFVTFKDPESARKACENPYPVIDGRRANCNLAYLGAHKNRPNLPQHGMDKLRSSVKPTPFPDAVKYFRQPVPPQHLFAYSAYGYPAYSQHINPMSYYNGYGGQQQQQYYTNRFPGVYLNYYPFYAQSEQSNTTHQYPKMVQLQMPRQSQAGPATTNVMVPGKAAAAATSSKQNQV